MRSMVSSHEGATVKLYFKTFLLVGASVGILMHFVTRESMPWWPDTVVMGAAFGTIATLGLLQHHRANRHLRNAVKAAFGRR
jgi:hypothetical protein